MGHGSCCTMGRHFNPRSHEGSDLCSREPLCSILDFNPRSHEGSDYVRCGDTDYWKDFNPRSHEGSDEGVAQFTQLAALFQSTLPRGERLSSLVSFVTNVVFQSTLPRGERLRPLTVEYRTCRISIHAPTRGATAIFAKKFSFLSAKIV